MERIGIYGGTFNPPHIGHMRAAEQAIRQLKLDRLLLIPDGIAPHKQLPEVSPAPQQRLQMLRIAAKTVPGAEILDIELCREGASYTYLTVGELHARYPQAELVLIMGADMFLSFHNWCNPEEITKYASLAVLYRGDPGEKAAVEKQLRSLQSRSVKAETVDNDVTVISSTDLRRMLVFQCAKPFLCDGVGEYILAQGLYGTCRDYRHLPMEELEKAVISLLNPNRVNHVLGCRDTAVALAKHWGADVTDAARAGILHDITKALDGPLQLTLCGEYGIVLNTFSARNPKTLHALTGSAVAQRIFGENEAVVSAIRHHTTGKAAMSLLEKIIYVADYTEPNRDLPGVDRMRQLAFSDLDEALKMGLEMALAHVARQGEEISPESLEALAFLKDTL